MDSRTHAAHPSFLERLVFLIVRFGRMQQIGSSANFGVENQPIIPFRPLTEAEIEQGELVRLSSAAWHLSYGETTSRWSGDSYLARLVQAKPELRAKALEEHDFTEADYERWLQLYSETPIVH